ncbi:MAG: EAL and HDOD domain-containing protein [Desulfitobacteriaceae bacterium]
MNAFVARQPIFDTTEKIYAYELLFRHGTNNSFENLDGDLATSDVINNSFLIIGMDTITGGKRGFINFTTNLLLNQFATNLPKDTIVVEILENVEPTQAVIMACAKLKELGYLLALDDFEFDVKFTPLIELADIIKVDFRLTGIQDRRALINKINRPNIKYLAEKVETKEEFDEARDMGYSYFQGYYFSKPIIVSGKEIPQNKLNHFKLIQEINRLEVNLDQLEEIIKGDISLSYKLLKFINSAVFGLNSKVNSIRHALTLLGILEVRKWASLISLKSMGEDKPDELVVLSLVRARFGENIAQILGMQKQAPDIFLLGLLSMIDAFLDRPIVDILKELPISEVVKAALLGSDNQFRDIYELILSYEKADWKKFSEYALKLRLDETLIPNLYLKALDSANLLSTK